MKFSELWSGLKTDERDAMAKALETERGYLQQLAIRWRGKRPSFGFMLKMASADPRLTVEELAMEFSQAPPEKQVA